LVRFCKIYGAPDYRQRTEDLISKLGLGEFANMEVRKLSAGTKQRVAIARAVINRPSLLILDEFLSDVDPVWRYELKKTLKALKDEGCTVLMATHILADVEELCDNVTLIKEGQVLYTGSLSGLYHKAKFDLSTVRVNTSDNARARQVLSSYEVVSSPDGALLVCVKGAEEVPRIVQLLTSQGLAIFEVTPLKPSLELVYARLHGVEG